MSPQARHFVCSLPQSQGLQGPLFLHSGALPSLGRPGGGQP